MVTIRRSALTLATLIAVSICTNVFAAVGRTPGKFAVSPLGSSQYAVPIWIPPGIRGLQPRLAFNYDSNLPYGVMGPGWMVSGFSVITRCNLTYSQDGTAAAVTLTAADGLCIDGKRLRPAPAGQTSTYQTEVANFSLVTASGTAGKGPSYFTVRGKDGLTYEYGNTTDSKVLPSSTATTPYIWALDKVTDRSGNQMTYTYLQSNGGYIPETIKYTAANGSTTFPYAVTFTYTTKLPSDITTNYIAGNQIQQTNELEYVNVFSSSTNVRQYRLTYTTSSATIRSRLYSIQECNSNTGGDCLPALNFGYQDGTSGVASPTTPTGSGATSGTIYSVDINGDGKKDLVFATTNAAGNNVWWVQLATATGYGAPISTGAVTVGTTDFLIDDFIASGGAQILAPGAVGGTAWYVYQLNSAGTAFGTPTPTGISIVAGANYSSADIDGDGRPDLVSLATGSSRGLFSLGFQLNTSSAGSISFVSTPVTQSLGLGAQGLPLMYGNNQLQNTSVKHMDFDGDGRQDLLLFYTTLVNRETTSYVMPMLSRGTGMPAFTGSLSNGNVASGTYSVANWNDDACTDLINNATVMISDCNGNAGSTVSLPAGASLAMDWDGDGRTDVLSNAGGTWEVYRSEGSAVAPGVGTSIPVGTGNWIVTDQNGDGLDDLVFANYAASYVIDYGLHNGAGLHPDLATSFNDNYGNTASPSYVALPQASTSVFTKGAAKTYPQLAYVGPLYVTSSAVLSDGIGGTYKLNYQYNQAVANLQGRGFAGFGSMLIQDTRNSLLRYIHYDTDFPWIGFVTADGITQSNSNKQISNLVSHLSDVTLDPTANNERYWPYVDTATATEYEVGGAEDATLITTAVTSYKSPDNYGNFATIETTLTDNDANSPDYNSQWTSTVATTVSADVTNWCLNMPTEVDTTNTAPGVPSITRHEAYTPDTVYCRQKQKVTQAGTAYAVTDVFTYDNSSGATGFGNLTSEAVTGTGMPTRTTTIGWGTTGQFPAQTTNALNQITYTSFDPVTGHLLSITDPNGIKASWQYDDFARKIKELRPDGTSTTWAYNNCSTAGCVNTNNQMTVVQTSLNTDGTTLRVDNTYLDSQDRTLVKSGQMIGGAYNRTEVQYDNLGRVYRTGMPCNFSSCTQYWITNYYDVVNRLTQSQRPINASNSTLQNTYYGYQGRTRTVQDPQSKVTTSIMKVTGGIGRSIDANGYYVNFNYDAFGSVLSVTDSLSNTLHTNVYQYGIEPFVVSSTDMDLGNRSFTVDPLGEVTGWSDAKSQSFSMAYDALSRPKSRTEPDLSTSWNWGTGTVGSATSYDIGQLQSVSSTDSTGAVQSSTYSYDSHGRLIQDVISNPGDRTYTYGYTYNATTGLLDTLQYPVDISFILTLQYGYSYGILQSVLSNSYSPSVTYWTANSTNARGQVTQEVYGNGAFKTNAYDAVTGWLSSVQASTDGLDAGLQNSSFLYDYVGNLTQREDNNRGLTENFYYDNVYRLDHSTLGGTTNLQMVYDGGSPGPGNITSRSDIAGGAAWTYDPVKKHAVLTAGSSAYTYSYDANGNASTRNGYTVGWTSYNYPLSVTTASESVAFSYGPDRQRWKEVYTNASGTETTYHAGKLFEVAYYLDGGSVLAHYRHYVYAGNELVAIDDRSTATTPQYYVVSDHQGSFASIENGASGASPSDFVSESFTAFGNRRNGETWSGAPTPADEANINIVSRRGYTGESALGIAMGLNHLNGRIEDAITGRFLSPDPYIPDPTNTQDFNRYSYVDNNPMSLIDPTGFDSAGGSDDSGGDSPGGNDGISPIVVYGSRGWNGYNGASGFAAFSSFGSGAVGTQLFNSYVASNSMFGALYPVNPAFDSTTFLGTNDDSNQEADLSEVSVTAQRMTDSSGPTLKEFSDRISEESADRQRLLDQSRNFTFDTRTYWQRLKDNFSRSGAKIASFGLNLLDKGLTVASFIPVADEGAIPLLAAERGLAARGATTLARDATGKIHGILPKIEDLKNASPAQIRENIEELRGSVLARKQELERLGEEGAHRARIGQEESLLRSLEGRLEDLFGAKNAPP